MPTKYATRDECIGTHKELSDDMAEVKEDIKYIRGKIDGLSEAKSGNMQTFGIMGAYVIALINMFK